MYFATVIFFIGLPLGLAGFLLWRAFQLGVRNRSELTNQWLGRNVSGIEAYAKIFALRDLIFAMGCLLFIGLFLTQPLAYKAWISILAMFGSLHQATTHYVVYRINRKQT